MNFNIYEIKNKINNKKYIGGTSLNIDIRYCVHLRDGKKYPLNKFYKEFNILTKNNFELKLLETVFCDKNSAKILEQKYINENDGITNGYNTKVTLCTFSLGPYDYYKKNIEKYKQKITCQLCGKIYLYGGKYNHENGLFHKSKIPI